MFQDLQDQILFIFLNPVNPVHFLLLRSGATSNFADVILRFRNTHDPFVEPTDDVLQALDAMPRLT